MDQLIESSDGEIRVRDNFIRGLREVLAAAMARRPIRLVEGDIRDRATVQRVVDGCDYVFHQAAIKTTG